LLQDTGYNDYANDTYTYTETPPAAQDPVPVVEE
jgi:hypothetical protein